MNVEEAWDAFVKSQAVKKASIDEKLDVLASQMNEVQTTVDRLAETIPEAQGDAGAVEMANDSAMVEPNPEEALGEVAGAPEEEGVAAPGGSDAPMPEEEMGEDELGEEDLAGDMPPMDEEPELGGEDIPPLTEEDMDTPAIGESNDVISMVKEMISSEDDPDKLSQLSRLLDAAVNTRAPQNNQSLDVAEGDSEMQMMKSDSVAKAGEGTGVVGEKSTVDTDGDDTGGKDPTKETPGAAAAEAAVDRQPQDAPKVDNSVAASADTGPTPELMEKIMDAVKGVLVEFFGEGSEEDIDESAEEAATDGEEVKVDDEDAEVHIDVEDGGEVEVEDEDDDDGDEEISDADKIDRNDELSDDSEPFADSDCINKSFADMLHGKISGYVGIDGQFAKNNYKDYQNHIESKYLNKDESNLLSKLRGENKSSDDSDTDSVSCTPSEVNTVVGDAGMTGSNSTDGVDAACKSEDSEPIAESEDVTVAESGCAKTEEADVKKSTDNGKPIMSLKDMMAVRKSADRMDVSSTSNGSLTPPDLEGAAPIKMSSFKDMMGSGSIRKSIEADADAYRLYKSQQNM